MGPVRAAIDNPLQQGLKPLSRNITGRDAQMAAIDNPLQQGLKPERSDLGFLLRTYAAIDNPLQQGLKLRSASESRSDRPAAIDNPLQQGLKRVQAAIDGIGARGRNRQSTTTGIETDQTLSCVRLRTRPQ